MLSCLSCLPSAATSLPPAQTATLPPARSFMRRLPQRGECGYLILLSNPINFTSI